MKRIVCYICHRRRPADQLEERRCVDREGCYQAMAAKRFGRPVPSNVVKHGSPF